MNATVEDRGPCARCGEPAYIEAYWGHLICQPCAHLAAEYFDAHDNWPPLPADDRAELDAGLPELNR